MNRFIRIILTCTLPSFCYAQSVQKKLPKDIPLVGTWIISATEFTEVVKVSRNKTRETTSETVCNVCSVITYNSDSTGYIIGGNGSKSLFKWTASDNRLTFINLSKAVKEQYPILHDGVYTIIERDSGIGLVDTSVRSGKLIQMLSR